MACPILLNSNIKNPAPLGPLAEQKVCREKDYIRKECLLRLPPLSYIIFPSTKKNMVLGKMMKNVQRVSRRQFGCGIAGLAGALAIGGLSSAKAHEFPETKAVNIALEVTTKDGDAFQLSVHDIDHLPQSEIKTTTPWTSGERIYTGPTLRALFEHYDLTPSDMIGTALNGYSAVLDRSVIENGVAILATRCDGQFMPVTDKGPFFIVFPFSDEEYWDNRYFDSAIWQLVQLSQL